jgi:hypothetical protein
MKAAIHSMIVATVMMVLAPSLAATDGNAPWGGATFEDAAYAPQKVVYDVAVSSPAELGSVLDRVSYLNNLYEADPFDSSIVVVLHGDEIPQFAVKNQARDRELMERVRKASRGGTDRVPHVRSWPRAPMAMQTGRHPRIRADGADGRCRDRQAAAGGWLCLHALNCAAGCWPARCCWRAERRPRRRCRRPMARSACPSPCTRSRMPRCITSRESGVPDTVNEGHTSNAGFVVTPAGVVVFDALGTPALGYRMLQRIREVTDQPVKYVVVSHYHADHIYGLQAFKEHGGAPTVLAQRGTLGYAGGTRDSQGEDAQRRLEQRREALFPWVDEKTYIVAPDEVFDQEMSFELGGVVSRSGTSGRPTRRAIPSCWSGTTGCCSAATCCTAAAFPFSTAPKPTSRVGWKGWSTSPAWKTRSATSSPAMARCRRMPRQVVEATRDYILYVREAMARAVRDFVPFDEAYRNTDWSRYENLPAFDASNRGNAFRIYLEEEARSLK